MDNPDIMVDTAHDDARTGRGAGGTHGSPGQQQGPRPGGVETLRSSVLAPGARGSLVSNPLRVRL